MVMSLYYCGSGSSTYYSWTLSEDLKRINIYRHSELLKAMEEENPEEFKRMELLDRYDEMELLLVIQDNGDLGLEIIDCN